MFCVVLQPVPGKRINDVIYKLIMHFACFSVCFVASIEWIDALIRNALY